MFSVQGCQLKLLRNRFVFPQRQVTFVNRHNFAIRFFSAAGEDQDEWKPPSEEEILRKLEVKVKAQLDERMKLHRQAKRQGKILSDCGEGRVKFVDPQTKRSSRVQTLFSKIGISSKLNIPKLNVPKINIPDFSLQFQRAVDDARPHLNATWDNQFNRYLALIAVPIFLTYFYFVWMSPENQ